MRRRLFFLAGFWVLLTACQGGENRDAQKTLPEPGSASDRKASGESDGVIQGQDFQWRGRSFRLEKGVLRIEDNCLVGEGQIRWADRLRSEESWNLGLDLRIPSGGSLELLLHERSEESGGLRLRFSPGSLQFIIGSEMLDWSGLGKLAELLSQERLRFSVDIHNDERHKQFAHLLFFDAQGATLMDSALDTDGIPGKGRGKQNRLRLNGGASLCDLTLGTPRNGG